jgi:hypothetical protein
MWHAACFAYTYTHIIISNTSTIHKNKNYECEHFFLGIKIDLFPRYNYNNKYLPTPTSLSGSNIAIIILINLVPSCLAQNEPVFLGKF